MTDISPVSLINQKNAMTMQGEGLKTELVGDNASFSQVMQKTLNSVNDLMQNSDRMKTSFELGDSNVSLADVMVASQKSSLAFEATLRVRNKLLQAYKDIMDMPV